MLDVLKTRLGRYEIRERIGKGGMSVVYKAWDTALDRWVAVKVLHDYLSEEKDFRARFEREAKIVAGLNHPNIVQVYDFAALEHDDQTTYYMVMQYIEGESLRLKMEAYHASGAHMPLAEVARVMRGICAALGYAHAKGMVHRDVTPGNVLFNAEGQAVLADFGIARMVSGTRLTQSGTTSGTPIYMSPEQGIGEPGDKRSDIYSLGIILFEMLTGQAPYEGDSAFAVLMKHVNEPVPSPLDRNPQLPQPLESVIFQALAKVPDDRYQRVEDLMADFENALGGKATAVAVRPAAAQRPGPASSQTNRARIIGMPFTRLLLPIGVVAALILAAALIVTLPRAHGTTLPLNAPPLATRKFAPSMTSGPLTFTDTFDPERGKLIWPVGDIDLGDGRINRAIENGVYRIRHTLKSTALTTLFDEYYQYADNYSYEADFTISENSQRDTAAGIVFRFRNDDQYYVFAVDGQGQVSIWRRYQGEWRELRGLGQEWTPAPGVNLAGKTNHLKLIDSRDRLIAIVNDRTVIEVQIEEIWYSGGIGIYLASTRTDVSKPFAEVVIDNFSAQSYRRPSATPTSGG